MADMDDFAAFLAEVQTAETVVGTGDEAKDADAGDKRPRAEEEEDAAKTAGDAEPVAPVLKKAKVVVARAKPQVFQAAPQPAEEPPAQAPRSDQGGDARGSGSGGGGGGGGSSGYMSSAPPQHAGPGMPPGQYGGPQQGYMYGGQQAQFQKGMGGGGGGDARGGAYDPAMAAASMAAHQAAYGAVPPQAPAQAKKPVIRMGAGETWLDPTLSEWPDNDFRLFCGDLGNEVNDEALAAAFKKYTSFAKAKVIREKLNGKSKGYGFVSFLDPFEGLKAFREMNNKYIGSRPVKLKRSEWKDRNLHEVKKKDKQKKKFLKSLGLT